LINLSVIVPTFCRHENLKKKLDEAFQFQNENIEFIFVLEREDLLSQKIVKDYQGKNVRIVYNTGDHQNSFNEGAKHAEGKFLSFMGDDDFIIVENFRSYLSTLSDNQDKEWFISGAFYIESNTEKKIRKTLTKIKFFLLKNFNKNILSLFNFVMTPSVIVKRQAFLDVGGFKERYKYAQDYYCWIELSKKFQPYIIKNYNTKVSYDQETFSGSFDFRRYLEYFLTIQSYEKNLFFKILQLSATFYILLHNFFFKFIIRNFKSIISLFSNELKLEKKNNRKIKIAHISRQFEVKKMGGIEQTIMQISKTFDDSEEHHLFTCGKSKKNYIYENIHIHVYKTNLNIFNSQISIRLCIELFKNLNYFKIIYFHSPWPTIELITLMFLKNVRILFFYHADVTKFKKLSKLYYYLLKIIFSKINVSYFVVNSKKYFDTSNLKKILNNENLKKVYAYPAGLNDLTKIQIKKELIDQKIINFYDKKKNIFLFFGRLRHYKGIQTIDYLLQKNKNINFLISSEDEILNKYINNDNILLIKSLNFDEKLYVLKNSYFHLFPSSNRSESLGLALIEAQMFGLPSMIYEINTGTSEIIKNNHNGIVLDSLSYEKYNEQVSFINSNESKRKLFSLNARKNYETNYSSIKTRDLKKILFPSLNI
jgi:glycosyltransferase involved in cell wall biosynthesis